ncbi:hypothetical protein YC2023_044558 [Brassica napus]
MVREFTNQILKDCVPINSKKLRNKERGYLWGDTLKTFSNIFFSKCPYTKAVRYCK